MAKYAITSIPREIGFASYRFAVFEGDRKVAEIEHDYRGEDFFVSTPVGRGEATDRILTGGGPDPVSSDTF